MKIITFIDFFSIGNLISTFVNSRLEFKYWDEFVNASIYSEILKSKILDRFSYDLGKVDWLNDGSNYRNGKMHLYLLGNGLINRY